MYSFSYLEPVCCSMSSSNCCFLTCIQVSQEAGQVVWYSHLFQNFPQFIVIHTVKGFGIVNKAELDVFSGTLLLFPWSSRVPWLFIVLQERSSFEPELLIIIFGYGWALEKELATCSSVLAWRIPGKVEPDALLSMWSHRVGHDWSDLAAAAAAAWMSLCLTTVTAAFKLSICLHICLLLFLFKTLTCRCIIYCIINIIHTYLLIISIKMIVICLSHSLHIFCHISVTLTFTLLSNSFIKIFGLKQKYSGLFSPI